MADADVVLLGKVYEILCSHSLKPEEPEQPQRGQLKLFPVVLSGCDCLMSEESSMDSHPSFFFQKGTNVAFISCFQGPSRDLESLIPRVRQPMI